MSAHARSATIRVLVAALAAAATALVAAGCGASAAASDHSSSTTGGAKPVVLHLGWAFPGGNALYVMMAHHELMPNYGKAYTIDWSQSQSSSQVVQGLAAGSLDGGYVGASSVLTGYGHGADIDLVGEMGQEVNDPAATTFLVKKSSPITTAADVRGKKVGTLAPGTQVDLIGQAWFKQQAGLSVTKDYTDVSVPFATMQTSLSRGDIAVGTFVQPYTSAALATGQFRTLFTTADVQVPFVETLLGFNNSFVTAHRAAVAAFASDFSAVNRWMALPANRAAGQAAAAAATHIPLAVISRFLLVPGQDLTTPADGALQETALQANWNLLHADGFYPQYEVSRYVVPGVTVTS